MKSINDTYNDSSHRGFDNKTPNEVFNNQDNQLARHLSDTVHNHNIYKSVPFKENDKVRVIEEKGKFDKGKQKFSKDIYTIDKKEGYKIILKDTRRKLKPSELLKVDTVSNPISQAYIDRTIKSKNNVKVTNKLIGSYFGKEILLYTPLLKWYLQHGLKITAFHVGIEYTSTKCLKNLLMKYQTQDVPEMLIRRMT